MTIVRAGELWVAEIFFTDGSASKKRPVLILWVDGDDVIRLLAKASNLTQSW